MDGTRIDRIEIDRDEDGRIDRWERYKDGKLATVGTSPVLRSVAFDEQHTGHATLRLLYHPDGSFDRTEHLTAAGR
jgi:hypothetical protein